VSEKQAFSRWRAEARRYRAFVAEGYFSAFAAEAASAK